MNMATTLSEITAMSVPERIRLVQLILDIIAADQDMPDTIPQSHKDELDRPFGGLPGRIPRPARHGNKSRRGC